jgi:hypothetical protein
VSVTAPVITREPFHVASLVGLQSGRHTHRGSVLLPFTGWLLSSIVASGAMAFSSVSVVLNSLRLRVGGRLSD